MARLVERASGWVNGRLRALAEWVCRGELAMLREEQRKFTAMLDAVDDQVVLNGPDGRMRFANRAARAALRDLTGRDPNDLLGKLPSELGLPDELVRFIVAERQRLGARRAVVTNEIAVPQQAGGRRWYEQKASPVFTDGRLSGHVMVGRDIDERKRAQRRLELLSKVSTLVGNLDLDALLPAIAQLSIPELADWCAVDVRCAKGMRRICVAHRDPEKAPLAAQLQGFRPWRVRAGWDDLAAGRSLFYPELTEEVLRANAESPEHLALVRQIGIRSSIAVPLRLHDATIAAISFAVTDESGRRFGPEDLALAEELALRATAIIDRVRLHAALEASEARFRVALNAGRTAVFEQDRELRYLWHYNAFLGQTAIGKTHADLFPKDEADQLTAIKRRVIETGEPVREEVRLTFGGVTIDVMLAIDPVRDDGGAIVGIIGAGTDITREKHAQEELARAVTFREQVMGILGHDLRNPLGAVLAATGILQRRADLAPPAREHVERIDRAARRMAEMIRTLLDVVQVRFHGRLPVSPAPTDLAEVASAIVDELRAAEPGRRIELEIRGHAWGVWDPARLGEVLSNLVGNALVHGAPGEPVRVAIEVTSDEVLLRVHNRGAAIAPETNAALFEPFRRGANAGGAAPARGLGLGLYIVREIVLAHDGAITVESTAADGTTFTVRLPREARAPAALSALPSG